MVPYMPYQPYTPVRIPQWQLEQQQQQQAQAGGGPAGLMASLASLYGGKKAIDILSSPGSIGADTPVATALNGGTLTAGGTVIPPTEPTTITNFAGEATPALGAAGVLAGGYNAYEGIKKKNPVQAGLGGGGAWLGLNAMGYSLGPAGWAMVAAPTAAALLSKAFKHKSTRDVAKDHTTSLLNTAKDNPTWQNYVEGMRAQYNSAPPDPSRPYAGKYATFNEYKKAGLQANDLTGVYGNLKTFGPDWANYSQQQRQAITQGLIDQGLYNSKKGEVVVSDENRARQIRDSIINPTSSQTSNLVGKIASNSAQNGAATRSRTSSPGIDKNGKRINY